MHEHRRDPLLPFPVFLHRVLKSFYAAAAIVAAALAVGVLGYHGLRRPALD